MKLLLRCVAGVLLLAWLMPLPAAEPGITKKQADQILDELRQIRQLLEKQQAGNSGQPAVIHAKVSTDGAFSIGSKDAPITMVEFTDFQCPFCQSFHLRTFVDLKKNYIDTGKVRFVSRDFPLDFHPNAKPAAARVSRDNSGPCATAWDRIPNSSTSSTWSPMPRT